MAAQFFIKVVGVPNYEKMVRYPSFSRNIEKKPKVVRLIESIEPDDRFVLYVTGRGFVGILCVKGKPVFDASPSDPNYDNPNYPHYVEVKEAEVLRQEDALPLSAVREWSGKSDELERTLKGDLQGVGGIHSITTSDFRWFEQKIEQRLKEFVGILPTKSS
jgi:hypothetical protein